MNYNFIYKVLLISFIFLFACNDLAKKVDNDSANMVKSDQIKPSLSSNLVMNDKTSESNKNKFGMPEFSFEKELHDFGSLVDGEKVSFSFKFTNSGDAPLIISSAKGSCGCTVPNWPKDPIAPGESGSIDVTFNSSGRSGKQNKAITLTANTNPSRKVINITSEVITN
ncbi:MAG: hypothetical protein CMD38_01620 [Flavobacteriales bacterium]|nr:hypothetical protein [Flavobacteriales bacterium]|tara:strand:- start:1259 stop:1762 length:504 start_codon:yes stop_codon:yes gene_type:complete